MVLQRGWSWANGKAWASSCLSADVYWALWASATLTTRRTMAGQEGAWPLAALSWGLLHVLILLDQAPAQGHCLQILPHHSQMASVIHKWPRLRDTSSPRSSPEPKAGCFEQCGKWVRILQRPFFLSLPLILEASPPLPVSPRSSTTPSTQENIGTNLPFSLANHKCLILARPHAKVSLVRESQALPLSLLPAKVATVTGCGYPSRFTY